MAITTSYDPDTLAFMADQSTYSNGKKHYNPTPHLRIPRGSTTAPRSASGRGRRQPIPLGTKPDPAVWSHTPVYLLSVHSGQEFTRAQSVQAHTRAAGAIVPRNADNEPLMPGFVLVAIADTDFFSVKSMLRELRWGILSEDTVDPNFLSTFLPYAETLQAPAQAFEPDHPLCQLAEAVFHREGWHGRLDKDTWSLFDNAGRPVTHGGFAAWWATLCRDWNEQQLPLTDIVRRHQDALAGAVVPVTLKDSSPHGDWMGTWARQTVRVRSARHLGIRPRLNHVFGLITGVREQELQLSVTHPDWLTHLLRYRLPLQATVRVPGRWAVIRVPEVTPTIMEHVRLVHRELGWTEQWKVVDTHNPRFVVSALLKPRDVRVDATTRQITVREIPGTRRDWMATAQQWLPDWTIVGL